MQTFYFDFYVSFAELITVLYYICSYYGCTCTWLCILTHGQK